MNWSVFILKWKLRLAGFGVNPSWSGFAVILKYPDFRHKNQTKFVTDLLGKYLPANWITQGPEFAVGGSLAIYAWPKDDPHLVAEMKNSSS